MSIIGTLVGRGCPFSLGESQTGCGIFRGYRGDRH